MGPVLDARCESARPKKLAGSDRGEASGWTPCTGMRQHCPTIKGAFELARYAPMVEQAAGIGTEGAMMRVGLPEGQARGSGEG